MKSILLVHLSGIGNLITVLPLVRKLKRIYPNACLDVLLDPKRGGKEILRNNPAIRNIYFLDPTKGNSKLSKLLLLYKKTRELPKYDIALTTYPNQGIYSAILMYLVAKKRIQHVYKYGDLLLTYAPFVERKHFVELNLDLLPYETIQEDYKYDYFMTLEENLFAEKFIRDRSRGRKVLIGIHPGSHDDMVFKRWNIENWVELINIVNKNIPKVHFFIFLGPYDNLTNKGLFLYDNVTIVKDLPLRKVVAIISKMHLFLSNDSGLAHIASLFSIPQIVLFGATDYVYSAPYSENAEVILPPKYEPFYIPHLGIVKKPNNYINLITPNIVFEKIKQILSIEV